MMYAVRIADTKELIGLFWGRDFGEVCCHVDEVLNANECEYKRLDSGGVWDLEGGRPKLSEYIEDDIIKDDGRWYPFMHKARLYMSATTHKIPALMLVAMAGAGIDVSEHWNKL